MDSRERVLKALNLQRPDKVPVVPFIISFAARYVGLRFIQYCKDASNLAKAQIATAERFKLDAVYVDSDAVVDIEAMGAEVKYFEDEVPVLKEEGGYMPGADHVIPVEMTLERFKEYAEYIKPMLVC